MSETTTTPPETPDATPPATGAPETFSREYVEGLRREAAQYRTERNSAAETARQAAQAEAQALIDAANSQVARLTDDLGESWILVEKLQQSIDAGVPADKLFAFAAAVQGVDQASIKSSAASLKTLFGITGEGTPPVVGATDPTQGSGQRGLANPGSDPILKALVGVVGK